MTRAMRAVVVVGDAVGDAGEGGVAVASHRHTSHEHEHDFEPVPGLPEPLPAGERVLWQGAPDFRTLARSCFHARKLAIYFALLVAWRAIAAADDGATAGAILIAGASGASLAGVALALVAAFAWMSSRTTLYTITDRRVVLRVGIVLSVTFNLPFRKIESAGLHALAGGHGDIALELARGERIAVMHLWPHVRPWHWTRTQPSLRCIADAADVARTLTTAWRAERAIDALAPAEARVASVARAVPARTAAPALPVAQAA